MVKYALIVSLLMVSFVSKGQNINAFAVAKSNRQNVLVEQGLKVTVTVYTSTWFTQPLQIENLQMEGAFVQSFKQTLSSIRYVNNKKYASLEFYYIVFPYKDGEMEFPALNIITETPAEGDYKGQRVTLSTKPFKIKVKPIPKNTDTKQWLVAKNASIESRWNNKLDELKVGDVLQRTITTRAQGTLPSFIEEPQLGEVEFGNIYTSAPKYYDERNSKSVNGRRVDKYSYLLEQKGNFTIPEIELSWYNPYVGKFYKRSVPAVDISILPNPDMANLTSLRDSLNALNPTLSEELSTATSEPNYKKWGLIGFASLLGLLALYILIKVIVRLVSSIKKRRMAYRHSEAYFFRQLMHQKNETAVLTTIYRWLDNTAFIGTKTLRAFAAKNNVLKNSLSALKKNRFSKETQQSLSLKQIKAESKKQRQKLIDSGNKKHDKRGALLKDINP
ncbi:BatD family protein [Carboxylicivirga sp. M1479]|uniref:BatD family protein n=1 Tax=Carboxylicivirga sp. M1479 TaxID=2594476 RepID=UPI001178BB5B|nr:BatD family protein [Carboxylicivirga sp. M1479]TRX72115.1 protein BatD [Carboxylicivirga sp. M1479]